MAKKITMQDIARELNISKNSVSQALSGKPGVSEETRQLIKTKAEELGYQYSIAKKQNQANHSGNIALIASDLAFSLNFFGDIYLTIEKEVNQRGMNLLIQSIDDHTRDHLSLPSFVQDRSVSGIIILSHISTDYINRIIDTGIPTVLIDHHHPLNPADAILINNRFAAFKAVHHLINLGHKQIGFLGDVNRSPSYQERYEGFLLALKDNNVKLNNKFVITEVKESGEGVGQSIDKLDALPTAWFCTNDGLGFFLLTNLQSKGINVPADVSVCSFDNGQLSRISNPKTTTMNVDLQLYGKKAIEQLFWRMDHPNDPIQEILIDSNLIVRESTTTVKNE
ncbi:LacI family transcriptional regulator [Salipaludibacillus keqinensis]|uniref:LacI family transcriptional regulator n=1 Tax=Salipaludibacillus keqinensis TaxID=2045207 RepID=A0A323TID9_9BACI|nr:substrate-binding domain-containing protein [Salipaludibacillus keqinensis]PYZ94661.1 LacI family transcriptional regulator [Salipaludibacillus keqinensis]